MATIKNIEDAIIRLGKSTRNNPNIKGYVLHKGSDGILWRVSIAKGGDVVTAKTKDILLAKLESYIEGFEDGWFARVGY